MILAWFRSAVLILFSVIGFNGKVIAQENRPQFVIGQQYTLNSDILNEDRTFWVSLPQSYASSKGYRDYPVLYVLDGNLFFHSFTGVVSQLSGDATPLIPEMIVVGVNSKNRLRDSTPTSSRVGPDGNESDSWAASGGGEAFQRFLEEELIPYIDARFATNDYRILAGYSLTGLPVLYNLFTRPDVFDAHIVMDASVWWDDYMIMDVAREALATESFTSDQLFISTTIQRYPAPYITVEAGGRELAKLLQASPAPGLRVMHHERSQETHHNLATISLYEGLISIFDGHMMTLDELYMTPEAIPIRFEKLSKRLGHSLKPPEGVINFFGYNFMSYLPNQEMNKALIFFKMNVESYPRSPNAWASLGEAYAETRADEQAVKAFERALELEPENKKAERGLTSVHGRDESTSG
jgi:predicted alpha/beta superfamily hydrolase